jgi:hypothetical protein
MGAINFRDGYEFDPESCAEGGGLPGMLRRVMNSKAFSNKALISDPHQTTHSNTIPTALAGHKEAFSAGFAPCKRSRASISQFQALANERPL